MATTIKEIAQKLGISISTVSKGLNGASDISEELRQMVLDTAIQMDYKTKKMRNEEHKKLCVFIENMEYETTTQFGYDIVLGFRQMAARDNWDISIVPINPTMQSSNKYDSYMLKNGYSGSYMIGLALQDDWIKQLEHTKFPTVLLDNYIKFNPLVGYVGTDSYEGIDLAVDHLVKLGHKKIAYFSGSPNSMVTTQRYEAYINSMSSHKLMLDKELIAFGYYVADSARYHVPALLRKGATAIVCGSDLMAAGAIEECLKSGFKVPEDISIVGFDDLPVSSQIDPPLTTIRQDRINIGKSGYYVLSCLMNHVSLSKANLRALLIVRSSTGPCKKLPKKVEGTSKTLHEKSKGI